MILFLVLMFANSSLHSCLGSVSVVIVILGYIVVLGSSSAFGCILFGYIPVLFLVKVLAPFLCEMSRVI